MKNILRERELHRPRILENHAAAIENRAAGRIVPVQFDGSEAYGTSRMSLHHAVAEVQIVHGLLDEIAAGFGGVETPVGR